MGYKKQALVLFSSPHKNGFTANVLNLFIKNATEYEFTIINCYERLVKPCIDCGYCKINTSCIYKDMDDIDKYLRKIDLLVIACPIYNFSFPAPLKLILDRMQRYFSARFSLNIKPPISKRKKAVVIASCGSDDNFGIEIIKTQLKKIFTIVNCELLGTIILKETDKINRDEIGNKMEKKVIEVINKL